MKNSADHILQIAIELEHRGRTFYESLSLGCGDPKIATLATSLAKSEGEHITTFKRMQDALPEELRGPRLTGAELFAASEELRKIILPNAKAVSDMVLNSDLRKALNMAIEMETEAVAFYSGLASSSDKLDADVFKNIAIEETRHLNMLKEALKQLST